MDSASLEEETSTLWRSCCNNSFWERWAFSHLLLVATMFEGKVPLKIRIADTGKLWGGFCLDHPAFLKECREWLGPENVVVRRKEKSE